MGDYGRHRHCVGPVFPGCRVPVGTLLEVLSVKAINDEGAVRFAAGDSAPSGRWALKELFDRDYAPDCDGSQHGGLRLLLRDVRKLARLYNLDFEVECDGSDDGHAPATQMPFSDAELLPNPPHAPICPWCANLGKRCERCTMFGSV